MNEESSGKTAENLNAIANLAKAVPVYDDALKPIAQETGKALGTVGRAVNACLAPIRGFVWGAEKIEDWLANNVAEKLVGTPESEIQTPDLSIAGPTIEALKFNGHKAELSDMFAGLLAGAMKKTTSEKVHPTFVSKISSMSVLDARLFEAIARKQSIPTIHISQQVVGRDGASPVWGFYNPSFFQIANDLGLSPVSHPNLVHSSIENLSELGLIQAKDDGWLTSPESIKTYEELEVCEVVEVFNKRNTESITFVTERSYVRITATGKMFAEVVLGLKQPS